MLFKRSKDDHPIVTRTLNNICNDAEVSHTPSVNVTSLRHRGTVQGRGCNILTGDKNIYYTSYKGRKCFIMPLIDFNVTVLKLTSYGLHTFTVTISMHVLNAIAQ